jgi:uncharacterized membrane protein YgcG
VGKKRRRPAPLTPPTPRPAVPPLLKAHRRRARLVLLALAAIVIALVFGVPRTAPLAPSPARPDTVVLDKLGILSADFVRDLNAQLFGLEEFDMVVHLDGQPPAGSLRDWTTQTVHQWSVGRAGQDRGLVLFVFRDAGIARVEVGYGLESRLPDAWLRQMLQLRLVGPLALGRYEAGIDATVQALRDRVQAEPGAPGADEVRASAWTRTWHDAWRHGSRLIPAVVSEYRQSPWHDRLGILAFATPPLLVLGAGAVSAVLALQSLLALPAPLRAWRNGGPVGPLLGALFLASMGLFMTLFCGAILVFVFSMAPDLLTRQGLFGGGGATVTWTPASGLR